MKLNAKGERARVWVEKSVMWSVVWGLVWRVGYGGWVVWW